MDDALVLEIINGMDEKIDSIQTDNEMLKKDVEYLKANSNQYVETHAVECTCDPEKKWRSITLTFIEDQEKAFKDFKEIMETDVYNIRRDIKKVEENILEVRKQIE